MSTYKLIEKRFGGYNTIQLSNESNGSIFNIVLLGAIPLNFMLPLNGGKLFDILDGFASPNEFQSANGARGWIMAPFSNKIPDGIYSFDGITYHLEPLPPMENAIHGYLSQILFEIDNVEINSRFIEITLLTKTIRPGIFKGYPFAIDISVKYRLQDFELFVEIIAENVGDIKAPFATGWHPYFKTSDNGIEHLVLTVDSEAIILLDQNYLPLSGDSAYGNINDFPWLDFRSSVSPKQRVINGRVINSYFDNFKKDKNGYFTSSIYDPENGLEISISQKEGVTLLFTGDSLAERPRKSIALEPIQFITNAFNREELKDAITVLPGQRSVFEFVLEISNH